MDRPGRRAPVLATAFVTMTAAFGALGWQACDASAPSLATLWITIAAVAGLYAIRFARTALRGGPL